MPDMVQRELEAAAAAALRVLWLDTGEVSKIERQIVIRRLRDALAAVGGRA